LNCVTKIAHITAKTQKIHERSCKPAIFLPA
jgi:hypothetical protein